MVNQFKTNYNNDVRATFPIMLHKFIRVKKDDSLKNIDKGNFFNKNLKIAQIHVDFHYDLSL